MARTKQTERISKGGKVPRTVIQDIQNRSLGLSKPVPLKIIEKKRKEIREEREEHKRMKMVSSVLRNYDSPPIFCDLMIKLQNSNDQKVEKDIFEMLKKKISNHVCGQGCSALIPMINYSALNAEHIYDDMVLHGVDCCHEICDEKCGKSYSKFAFEILDEFIKEQVEFVANVKEVKILPPPRYQDLIVTSETNVDRLQSFIVEYRNCGKMCLYKKVDFDFEILILAINKYEYLYFGHAHSHALYGMPGLRYSNSDGSSDNVTKLFPKKTNDSFDPIPLDKLLEDAKKFLKNVLNDGYH